MQQKDVRVTDVDSQRLQRLIEGSKLSSGRGAGSVAGLKRLLAEASVTPAAAQIGPDRVTVNSEVVLTDLDSGERFAFQVVFPRAGDTAVGKISVLAPLGMAVLGRRVGQQISWHVPGGLRRLRVDDIIREPETSLEGLVRGVPERRRLEA